MFSSKRAGIFTKVWIGDMSHIISPIHPSVNIPALIRKRSVFLSSRGGILTKVWIRDISWKRTDSKHQKKNLGPLVATKPIFSDWNETWGHFTIFYNFKHQSSPHKKFATFSHKIFWQKTCSRISENEDHWKKFSAHPSALTVDIWQGSVQLSKDHE